jgi:two-component system chemotaxis sensor kinase CheA
MDHGLESAAIRSAAGKDPVGTIRLGARSDGSLVSVWVEDDGAGLDTEAIHRQAIAQRLVPAERQLSAAEIRQLILRPGFSTARSPGAISGRGVGLDVVRQRIEGLHGSLSLDSQPGGGTRFLLRIPLSLSVVEALLVMVAGQAYTIDLSHILACRDSETLERLSGGKLVTLDGQPIPFIDLASFFEPGLADGSQGIVVFIRHSGRTIGLRVDEVRHSLQAVIKPLGRLYSQARGVNGAVVLGDGSLALMIDSAHFLAKGI